ncbi:transposase [Bradyrhizobium sp. USDA 3686]|nr:transposase [Bradyrhizobium canariense]
MLAADAGACDEEIARSVGVGGSTMCRIKRRFVEGTGTGAERRAASRARRKLMVKEEALLVAMACASSPEGRARWTLEWWLADAMVELTEHRSLPHETVRRCLAENGLKPCRKDM